MRFRSGRWTVVLTAAFVVPSFLFVGCKSGTNLVSLPKMPKVDLGWGKDKPSETDVAKNEASQLPPPPSAAAFNSRNGADSPYGTPRFPNTGQAAVQPVSAPYGSGGYSPSPPTGNNLAYNNGGSADPYSPAYATRPSGSSGGFYDGGSSAYERTANRNDRYGGAGYSSQTPSGTYGDRYAPSPYDGQYRDSRSEAARGAEPVDNQSYGSPYDVTPAGGNGYTQPANFESGGGVTPAKGGTADSARVDSSYDTPEAYGSPYGQPNPSGAPLATNRKAPACTGDSCPLPGSTPGGYAGTASATPNPHYRPGNTGDLDRQQWIPSSSSRPASGADHGGSAYENYSVAQQTGYETDGTAPRDGVSSADSQRDYDYRTATSRDSQYGTGQY
jgi:hypothetical protein